MIVVLYYDASMKGLATTQLVACYSSSSSMQSSWWCRLVEEESIAGASDMTAIMMEIAMTGFLLLSR